MEKVFKGVSLLYIINGDSILMRRFMHQDYEVLDVFPFKESDDIDADIEGKLLNLFGRAFPYQYFGNIESVINKESTIAHLSIKAYKVSLDEEYPVMLTYTDDMIKDGNDTVWLHKSEIRNEKRLREGDKRILERMFDDREIDIKITEDQGDRWIDAKTTAFEDR
jgi:hypothetical protein